MNMTWGEFKKLVEEAGVKETDTIWYIDISYPGTENHNKPEVHRDVLREEFTVST